MCWQYNITSVVVRGSESLEYIVIADGNDKSSENVNITATTIAMEIAMTMAMTITIAMATSMLMGITISMLTGQCQQQYQ